jgi:AcrR family transcriptional regulator
VGYGATFWWNGGAGAAAVSTDPARPGRRPGHSSTRQEIARAAREQFAAGGYDRVTLRAIAGQAGVDAALVAYFFGSKRGLFDEVINLPSDSPALMAQILGGGRRRVGERLARLVIETLDEEDQRQRIVGTIRTAAVEAGTARMIGDKFTTELLEPVVSQLGAGQAPLRAALVTSQILGLALARHVVGLEDLASASGDDLVAALGPTLQRYLVGDIS